MNVISSQVCGCPFLYIVVLIYRLERTACHYFGYRLGVKDLTCPMRIHGVLAKYRGANHSPDSDLHSHARISKRKRETGRFPPKFQGWISVRVVIYLCLHIFVLSVSGLFAREIFVLFLYQPAFVTLQFLMSLLLDWRLKDSYQRNVYGT